MFKRFAVTSVLLILGVFGVGTVPAAADTANMADTAAAGTPAVVHHSGHPGCGEFCGWSWW
ncbi:hypothetical protein RIF23_08640 [Lipingzhangella sp. LS1_29]|uniref:Uncharacterized protein n=1 Tax=Lipingzhangella rawalii TaxID=2055835 RepID=A0ABU2H4W6_9ACTN|nr:hypothetical protein [Lipingzhangella rawalii]MDS1270359.1 hypothetical protein [Lipingzhangella rawalii]